MTCTKTTRTQHDSPKKNRYTGIIFGGKSVYYVGKTLVKRSVTSHVLPVTFLGMTYLTRRKVDQIEVSCRSDGKIWVPQCVTRLFDLFLTKKCEESCQQTRAKSISSVITPLLAASACLDLQHDLKLSTTPLKISRIMCQPINLFPELPLGLFHTLWAFMRISVCLLKPRVHVLLISMIWISCSISSHHHRNVTTMVHCLVTTNLARIFHVSRDIDADLRAFVRSTQRRSSRHGSQYLNGGSVSRIQANSSNWARLSSAKHCARVHLQTDSTACWIVSGAKHATWGVSEGHFFPQKNWVAY